MFHNVDLTIEHIVPEEIICNDQSLKIQSAGSEHSKKRINFRVGIKTVR